MLCTNSQSANKSRASVTPRRTTLLRPLLRSILVSILVGCIPVAFANRRIQIATPIALQRAIAKADQTGGHVTIELANGTYPLLHTLVITAPFITLTGPKGTRSSVILEGDGMSPTARIGNLIRVSGSHFELQNMTLRRSRYHLIQIAGEDGAQRPVVRHCILENAYEQLLKVSIDDAHPAKTSNHGLVENCLFQYTAGIGPEYYIGGIDAHGAKDWIVRHNVFRNIQSPSRSVAEFAIHFWDGSANNIVEQNLIINCDRGIGFGLGQEGNRGGVIRNNMIYHGPGGGPFADVGIALESSPETLIYNNTIFLATPYPRAIEYRFPTTHNVLIMNNLTNKSIASRNGGRASLSHNVTDASASWFTDAADGNLQLAPTAPDVVHAGEAIHGLTDDLNGHPRPRHTPPNIGADQ